MLVVTSSTLSLGVMVVVEFNGISSTSESSISIEIVLSLGMLVVGGGFSVVFGGKLAGGRVVGVDVVVGIRGVSTVVTCDVVVSFSLVFEFTDGIMVGDIVLPSISTVSASGVVTVARDGISVVSTVLSSVTSVLVSVASGALVASVLAVSAMLAGVISVVEVASMSVVSTVLIGVTVVSCVELSM